jgi:hypothetical protein
MATYSREDFEALADAIGKHIAEVQRHETAFEAAAMWYRLSSKLATGGRITPYKMRRRMNQIATAAERLLKSVFQIPPKHRMVRRPPF